ncbi:MAG: MFS transporter [Thermoleophilaceae bacterium]
MPSRTALQRRTLRVLAAAQVLSGCAFFLGIAVAALLARDVSGQEALSGVPLALGVISAALAAVPLSSWMARVGRRPGLVAGHLIAGSGSAVVVAAAAAGSFALLCAGMAAFGIGNAANLLARYAATDLAPAERRARAISVVLLATAAGAILGPNLAAQTEPVGDWLGVSDSAAPFAVAVVLYALAAGTLAILLRPDPLLSARKLDAVTSAVGTGAFHALRTLPNWPALALTGVTAMAIGNVAMVAVMTMTPVHMEDAGQSLSAVGVVISLHVAGMYLPSPISGVLADRYGRLPVLAAGGAMLIAAGLCSGLAPGDHTPLVAVALILLGIGWNFGLVGGSALITDAVAPEQRPQTQGAADLVMGMTGATGSLMAGPLFHAGAFALLGAGAAGLGLLLILVASRARLRPGAAAAAG